MIFRFFTIILFFCFGIKDCYCQTLKFTSHGLLKEALPARIYAGKSIEIYIPFDQHLVDSQITFVTNRFQYLQRVMDGKITDEQEKILEDLFVLYKFFQDNKERISKSDCDVYSSYIKEYCVDEN